MNSDQKHNRNATFPAESIPPTEISCILRSLTAALETQGALPARAATSTIPLESRDKRPQSLGQPIAKLPTAPPPN